MEVKKRAYDLEERLIEFALKVDIVVEQLPSSRLANHLASQVIRSGTSPALIYGEAQSAESQRDFIHKVQIILKELRETRISLKIIEKKSFIAESLINSVFK